MERLRAEIAILSDCLGASARTLEERAWNQIVSETPVADHAYLVARLEHTRLERRLASLQAELGRQILEVEAAQA